jgi:hypothetical protein
MATELPPRIGNKLGQNIPTLENIDLGYKVSKNGRYNREYLIAKDSNGNTACYFAAKWS